MSNLKELITKLCPNGVKYRCLGDVCIFNRGTPLSSKKAISDHFPVVSGGVSESLIYIIRWERKPTALAVWNATSNGLLQVF